MRTFHSAIETVETYSPAEEQFNARRRTIGLFGGPAALALVWAAPLPIPSAAHRLAAIFAMLILLWLTEALPLAVTALLGPVLAVVFRVAPVRPAFASFADPVIFVFLGGFILAEAMFVHAVDRRIAYSVLSIKAVGASAWRILAVCGAITMLLSMWMSNTATTAMMFPIGLSLVTHLARRGAAGARNFALATMLMTSFAASIGGLATPVGTPPNLDQHRHARAVGGRAHHVRAVDGPWCAGRRADVRLRRHPSRIDRRARHAPLRRQRTDRVRGIAQARGADQGATQRADRVRNDRRVVAAASHGCRRTPSRP